MGNIRFKNSQNCGCSSTHSTFLHGFERIFPQKRFEKTDKTKLTAENNVTVVTNKPEESPGMPSVTKAKGLFQITEVNLQSSLHAKKFLSSVIPHAVTRGLPKNWLEN